MSMKKQVKALAVAMGYTPFDPNYHMYNILSDSYLVDGREFIIRIQLLKDREERFSYKSKLIVEILIAIECLLKSIFFSCTNHSNSVKDEYKNMRKLSHDLQLLINEIGVRAPTETVIQDQVLKDKIKKATDLGLRGTWIGHRYSIDAFLLRFSESVKDRYSGEGRFSGVVNDLFIEEMFIIANTIYGVALRMNKVFPEKVILTGNDIKKRDDAINDFARFAKII